MAVGVEQVARDNAARPAPAKNAENDRQQDFGPSWPEVLLIGLLG